MAKFQVKVYQMGHLFAPFDEFACVLEGEFEGESEEDVRERLWTTLNITHPEGYKGRSMSVGDVVRVGDKIWACMQFGWMEL
jgi:hypothetical protein